MLNRNNPQPDSTDPSGRRRARERLIWIGITTVLVALLVTLSFAPRVLAQSGDQETGYYLNLFEEVFKFVRNHYVDEEQLDPHELIEGALSGLMESLDDPHSAYLSSDDMRRLRDDTQGEFGGVGIYILNTEKGVEVARPIEGTPAERAGVVAGDTIIAVEGESIEDLTIDQVVKILRGKPGTRVTMTILRGASYTFDVTITREMIEVPTVRNDMITDTIAYLSILKFTPMTYDRVEEALQEFERKGYRSLILDVRSNPGGLLSSVVNVSDLFLPRGQVIVSTRSRIQAENRVYRADSGPEVGGGIEIAVLIDKYTASAAEILTGALKDAGRATVMGETSYGKGSVQQIIPVDGGGLRLTTSRYYTPAGTSIDKVGIDPDVAVAQKDFSEEEIESYRQLMESGAVQEFVQENTDPSEKEIERFIQSLREDGIVLRERRIRREIKNEVNRLTGRRQIYDLEYDTVLREAVERLQSTG